MAALTLKEGVAAPGAGAGTPFDVEGLAKHCVKNLPAYAVPVFLRFLPEYVSRSQHMHRAYTVVQSRPLLFTVLTWRCCDVSHVLMLAVCAVC